MCRTGEVLGRSPCRKGVLGFRAPCSIIMVANVQRLLLVSAFA